jgi:vacuolar-type H+-ATPase subunit I/STV1
VNDELKAKVEQAAREAIGPKTHPGHPFKHIEEIEYKRFREGAAFLYSLLSAERDAYKKAKAENDERFQLEAGHERAENERNRVRIAELEEQVQRYKTALKSAGDCGHGMLQTRILELEDALQECQHELEALRLLTQSQVAEFDRAHAANESLKYDALNRGGYELFVDGARWQFDRDRAILNEREMREDLLRKEVAAVEAENERLVLELIKLSTEHPCYKLSKELEADNANLRRALEACADWLLETEDEMNHQPGWQDASRSISEALGQRGE